MAKKAKRPRIFLETSGIIYQQHGHTLMQAAVANAIGNGRVEVSRFARMEYLRGVILNLIDLYFLIGLSESVSDALIDWSQKVNQERKLKIVLMTIPGWITAQEDYRSKEKSQRRLGDLIVRFVYAFDEAYRRTAPDPLKCQLGKLRFPRRTFDETILLRFYERFKAIQNGVPRCNLCSFKVRQQRVLARKSIDLHGPSQRQNHAGNKGYVTQAERLEEAAASKDTFPKCRWCERLGDSIIILHAAKRAIVVTADRAFEAFGPS